MTFADVYCTLQLLTIILHLIWHLADTIEFFLVIPPELDIQDKCKTSTQSVAL